MAKKKAITVKKINKEDTPQNDSNLIDILKILPLIIIIFLLPFIIRLKLIPVQEPFFQFWNGEKINPDFFTYYKQIFIYLMTAWALLHTFLFTKKIKLEH